MTTSVGAIVDDVGLIVTGSTSWIQTAGSTIAGNPMLLFMVLVSFVGIGIGLFKRLVNI